MAETALAFALKKAGVNTNAALLRSIAVDELRKANHNVSRALSPFTEEVRDAGGIMAELVPYAATRDLARAYLEGVAADMRGEYLKVPAKAGDGVRREPESQISCGPVDNSEGEGSRPPVMSQKALGPSPSDSVPSKDGGGIQGIHGPIEGQNESGSSESREGEAVQNGFDSQCRSGPSSSHPVRNDAVPVDVGVGGQITHGRVVPIPNKPRGLEAMKTRAAVHSVFDSYVTRDGIKIGDVRFSTLRRLETANLYEAALAKLIREHVTPVGDPCVRDVIRDSDLQRMIQKAAEISNG